MDKFQKELALQAEKLARMADNQPLLFLQQAGVAYSNYTKKMRRESKKMHSEVMNPVGVYELWLGEYLPKIDKIRDNVLAGKLKRSLRSILLVDDDVLSDRMNDGILRLRTGQIRNDFRNKLQLRKKKSRRMLDVLLSRNDDDISKQARIAVNFEQYKAVAKKHNFHIYDPNTGWLKRFISKYRARKQERSIYRSVNQQLHQLQTQTAEIDRIHNGLVGRLYNLEIDLIEILAARQEYEKALAKITPSPVKKVALYEKNTAKIRLPYLDRRTDLVGIKDLQFAAKELDDVLLTVFDLDLKEKNNLLTSVKKYRELTEEKQILDKKLSRKADQ